MKLLSDLEGKLSDAPEWREERGIVAMVQQEVRPGLFVYVSLGGAGLKVFRGEQVVAVPLEEVVRLAVAAAPGLAEGSQAERDEMAKVRV